MRLINYNFLWLLWSLPVLVGLFAYSFYRKRQALRFFASDAMLSRMNVSVSVKRQVTKAILLLAAVLAIIVALTQPGWNPRPEKIKRRGRDIVILIDVSRSMLAEDRSPNRLEHAKLAVGDLLDVVQGDRVGILAFAGTCVLKCPLTQDYGFVRLALADIGPDSVNRGGTNIGDAIRRATDEVFDQQERDFKDIILITDGEDHDTFPEDAANDAAKQGIRIFSIGLGDDQEGSLIPITGPDGRQTFVKDKDGKYHRSRLDSVTLAKIAAATGGTYWRVGTGYFDLAELYTAAISTGAKKELASTTVLQYDEKFQLFLALALALLIIEAMVRERKKT